MKSMQLNGVKCSAGLFNSAHASAGRRASLSRRVRSFEICWLESEGGVIYINEQAFSIEPGTVLCLRPGDECRIPLPYRVYYIRLEDSQGSLLGRMADWSRVFRVPVRDSQVMIDLVRRIADAQRREDPVGAMADLLSLLSMLEKEYDRSSRLEAGARKKTRESIRAGLEYIEEHFREKCTLKEIAAHSERSPIYFHDVFQEVMGMTPYEYIAKLRLDEAVRLLSLTAEEPEKIAEVCGFCSQSYFNFVFKKALGITPLNYRRALAGEYLEEKPLE